MENGTTWGTWLAYAAIVAFLVLLLAVVARTMLMFGLLTLMPLSRVGRWLLRLVGRADT
jgi:thiol:disulfide interchange protein